MQQANLRVPIWMHHFLIPLLFLALCPPVIFIFWYVNTALEGSFHAFWLLVMQNGLLTTVVSIWKPVFFGSPTAWKMIAYYALFQLFLMKIIPGKPFLGPVTPKGNLPRYRANGVICFFLTLGSFLAGAYLFHWFSPTIIYDEFGY